jgi:hypothetical protein
LLLDSSVDVGCEGEEEECVREVGRERRVI